MGIFDKLKDAKNMAKTVKELEKIMGDSSLSMEEPNIDDLYENIKNSTGIDLSGLDGLPDSMAQDMTQKIHVKFINVSSNEDPKFNHKDDSGFDFRANLPEGSVILKSLERKLIPTGLSYELPENYELQVRPRSGLAIKKGITVLNTPGTVDCGYRGEIKIILINLSSEEVTINHGDRVAQGVVNNILNENWGKFERVDELGGSERNNKGFGSSGVK
jgi:dUTP pyrophosphatase